MDSYRLFKEITVRMCSTLNLARGLGAVFPVLQEVFPLEEARLNILDTDMHAVKVLAIADHQGSQDLMNDPIVLPIPKGVEEELKGDGLEDIRTVDRIADDRASASVSQEYYPDVPESSMLIMRLRLENRRQGVLLLRAIGEKRYNQQHRALIEQLNEPFAIALNNALAHMEIVRLKDRLAEENRLVSHEQRLNAQHIVGASFGLSEVMQMVNQVASLDTTVLLLGETGVGKEVIADAIHHLSDRKDGPLVKMNCGAIPDTLIDSELFGHEKGAFTGAVSDKVGRFERADGGTLFMDEIGELPLGAQLRLLRVLQARVFERVGGKTPIRTDVRIIAATHRNLEQLAAQGTFRQDLLFRINVFPIHIPPLRERKQDIPALVNDMIERKSREMGIYPPPPLSDGAMERLKARDWPGNIRELQNLVERELILRRHSQLRFDQLSPQPVVETGGNPDDPPVALDTVIEHHIRRALGYTKGKVGGRGGAAELLGVNASTLRHRMRKLGIPYGRS